MQTTFRCDFIIVALLSSFFGCNLAFCSQPSNSIVAKLVPQQKISGKKEKLLRPTKFEKTLVEKIYDGGLREQVIGHYHAMVTPAEEVFRENAFKTRKQTSEYVNRKRSMAEWTRKQIVNERLPHMVLSNVDANSGLVKFLGMIRSVLGSSGYAYVFEKNRPEHIYKQKKHREKKLNEMTRMERYNHLQAKQHALASGIFGSLPGKVSTRFRAKWNLLKTTGNIRFQNPILTPRFEVNLREKDYDLGTPLTLHRGDRYTLGAEQELHLLDMHSSVKYGLQTKKMELNVFKKITDRISAKFSTTRLTEDDMPLEYGKRYDERLSMQYTTSF